MLVVLDAVATMDLDLLRRQRFMQQAQLCASVAVEVSCVAGPAGPPIRLGEPSIPGQRVSAKDPLWDGREEQVVAPGMLRSSLAHRTGTPTHPGHEGTFLIKAVIST